MSWRLCPSAVNWQVTCSQLTGLFVALSGILLVTASRTDSAPEAVNPFERLAQQSAKPSMRAPITGICTLVKAGSNEFKQPSRYRAVACCRQQGPACHG